MSLTQYKISIIVTGVTGLLRVKSTPRNTVKALHHLTFSDLVTPVTGLCARARVKKKLFNLLILISKARIFFLRARKQPVTPVTPVTTIVFITFLILLHVTNQHLPVTNRPITVTINKECE